MNSNLRINEFFIILVAFLVKTVLRTFIKVDSLLSLAYSSTDNWASVLESDSLLKAGIPIYEGDTVHQAPLIVYLFSTIANLPNIVQFLAFEIIDGLCVWLSLKLTKEMVFCQFIGVNKRKVEKSLIVATINNVRMYVCLLYAFNPFLAVSSFSQCITNFHNIFMLVLFYQIVRGNYKYGTVLCAWLSYTSLYPVVLLLALYTNVKWSIWKCVRISVIFLAVFGVLLGLSYYFIGNSFISNVYLHHFYLDDSTPQMNLYWYMMATMFDHFRLFFKWTFQLVLFSLCGGLTIKFSSDPVFLTYMLMWTITVLKPYPAIAELGMLLSLMPVYRHLFPYLRGGIVTFVMFLCVLCLAPLMQYLWMSNGTANANFYFAITLVHCAAQSHLASSILAAYAKFNFHEKHGKVIKNADGSEAQLRAK